MTNTAQKRFLAATALSVFVIAAMPAQAGFEWKAPAAVPAQAPAVQGGGDEIVWGEMPAQKVTDVETAPLGLGKQEVAAEPPAPIATDVVSGFGTDVPLSIALRQIVPQDYRFSLGAGVDPGMTVSWRGERPWKQVVTEMLEGRGLGFDVKDNVITVESQAATAVPVPPARAPRDISVSEPVKLSASKADMIPQDMISSGGRQEAPAQDISAPPMAAEKTTPSDTFVDKLLRDEEQKVAAISEPLPESMAPVAPPSPAVAAPDWESAKGKTLRETLSAWSQKAGVELYWAIDYDYRLNADVAFSGGFDEAVRQLFDQFVKVRPQPYGRLHRREGRPGVLVINSYDAPARG